MSITLSDTAADRVRRFLDARGRGTGLRLAVKKTGCSGFAYVVDLQALDDGYRIEARVRTAGRTGVEMEALTAVSVAALTIYDMVKAIDKRMVIGSIRLVKKTGGRSGDFDAG